MWSRKRESRQGRLSTSADGKAEGHYGKFQPSLAGLVNTRLAYPAVPAGLVRLKACVIGEVKVLFR